jgi:hypothetical protein
MSQVYTLNRWRFDVREDGSFYVVGNLSNGKRWETTQVLQLLTFDNCYTVSTLNSTYVLYF